MTTGPIFGVVSPPVGPRTQLSAFGWGPVWIPGEASPAWGHLLGTDPDCEIRVAYPSSEGPGPGPP